MLTCANFITNSRVGEMTLILLHRYQTLTIIPFTSHLQIILRIKGSKDLTKKTYACPLPVIQVQSYGSKAHVAVHQGSSSTSLQVNDLNRGPLVSDTISTEPSSALVDNVQMSANWINCHVWDREITRTGQLNRIHWGVLTNHAVLPHKLWIRFVLPHVCWVSHLSWVVLPSLLFVYFCLCL